MVVGGLVKMTYSECTYWHRCRQNKTDICIHDYNKCIIYQKMKVLDPREGYFIGAIHLEDLINNPKKSIGVKSKD